MRWNHRRTATIACMDCEAAPILCWGRCNACFKNWKRAEPKQYRQLRKLPWAQRKAEVAKMSAEKKAQRTPTWEYENDQGERELAERYGTQQDSKGE